MSVGLSIDKVRRLKELTAQDMVRLSQMAERLLQIAESNCPNCSDIAGSAHMIVSISKDGQHVCDLRIDDHHNWAEVCNAIRDRMFPDVKMDTSRPVEAQPKPEPKKRKRK